MPVGGDEGAADGDRAVELDVGVEVDEPGEDAEDVVGNWRAGEIVDEPAEFGVGFHPAKELDDLRLGEVMSEEGTEDEVGWLRR